MKKLAMVMAVIVLMAVCAPIRAQAAEGAGKTLVAYFSWADNAVGAEAVDAVSSPSVKAPGNVARLAEWVREATGGDLFPIQTVEPYSADWDACLTRGRQEQRADARPALKSKVKNLAGYDVVFLGYPNWWYGIPMALYTFFETHDLSGKRVYLFCSHGTGGLSNSVRYITGALPGAQIGKDVFHRFQADTGNAKDAIQSWARDCLAGRF